MHNLKLKIITFFSISTLLLTSFYSTIFASETSISIQFESNIMNFENSDPFINDDGFTMVPLLEFAEYLDLEIVYINDSKTIFIYNGASKKILSCVIGHNIAGQSNNLYGMFEFFEISTSPIIVSDVIYFPLRDICEFFGYSFTFDSGIINIIK